MIWELNVSDQVITFLISVVFGAVLCFDYDVLRGLRRAGIGTGTAAVFFADFLFWAFAALAVFCFLLVRTIGTVRFYVLLGLAVGAILFECLVSRLVVRIFAALFGLIHRSAVFFLSKYRDFCRLVCRKAKKLDKTLRKQKKTLETSPPGSV